MVSENCLTCEAPHDRAPRLYTPRQNPGDGPSEAAGFRAIDRRTAAARALLDFRRDLVSALGGDADLSPQRRRLIDMTVRAALLLDHVDAWIAEQEILVNRRSRSVFPIVTQRIAMAEHLAKLLDRLGLERVPTKIPTLAEYLSGRNGENRAPGATPRPTIAPWGGDTSDDHAAPEAS